MKTDRSKLFKLNLIDAFIALVMLVQLPVAQAGSGWGDTTDLSGTPLKIQTYYAHSPSGPATALNATGKPTIVPATGLPTTVNTGTALRKFVDTLPGLGSANKNNLGQYIPIAVPESNWLNPANSVQTADDYYEIAAVEFTEKLHSDLPKATRLRGYVQIQTPGLITSAGCPNATPLLYPSGLAIKDAKGVAVIACDKPHHLGPIIQAARGTAVRIKFTNYLPVGTAGNLWLPVDGTITGATTTVNAAGAAATYTQNRALIHLVGGNAPWISGGSPHQWVAPAGETAAYTAGLGKGASTANVPDMADPGPGSVTLYYPNDLSARFVFMQDRTSGITRLNAYAGLEAGYLITDPSEQALVTAGTIPADQIPLIIEDKTFVPANIAQQDGKWNTTNWGAVGDLWFPHVYETNEDPSTADGFNPVGRWDYGPWFWPIFAATAPLPSGAYGSASFTPEAYHDTPIINGTAYPTLTVDPKAYRLRILNASDDRYINLGLYKADGTLQAPQLDVNGNPLVDANGNPLYFTNTEVKMVPAANDPVTMSPPIPTTVGGGLPVDPNCLCQYPALQQLQPNVDWSGPNRAWPADGRAGGAPDPTAIGPDMIVIGNDGGFLPSPVDVPSQPVTFEQNRRSITVTQIYGYGVLLGPAERADAIVDFSQYAGQTLILYNDAPAPTPYGDTRNDYYTGDPDRTSVGGTYSTKPGYGPNTRTMMQIKVNAATPAAPFDPAPLLTALPAAYAAQQDKPIVPESAYNLAFGTNDQDNFGRLATGTIAQPNLDFTPSANNLSVSALKLVTSGGTGTGSGTGYLFAPQVIFNNGNCLTGTDTATATATVDFTTREVNGLTLTHPGSGYSCAPTVSFDSSTTDGLSTVGLLTSVHLTAPGNYYTAATTKVTLTGGNPTVAATAKAVLSYPVSPRITITAAGTGTALTKYTNPTVTFAGGGGAGAVGTVQFNATTGLITGVTVTNPGKGYITAPTVTIVDNPVLVAGVAVVGTGTGAGATATASLLMGQGVVQGISIQTPGSGYTSAPTITITDTSTGTPLVPAKAAAGLNPAYAAIPATPAGSGATAYAEISGSLGTQGTGAEATVVMSTGTQSVVVNNLAQQELFDTSGRYNTTGGIENPFVNATIQTTVPKAYIDLPTEFLTEASPVQIWKIVHNGFWDNTVHFSFGEVQLLNRIGWDGTVKAPAATEVGWRDSIRVNPLENTLIAVRAKKLNLPFGLPQSFRAPDPSKVPGVVVAGAVTPAVNVPQSYDNEFTWNSQILSHSEDDYIRPVVFTPTVTVPGKPVLTANGTLLTWTDPTPAASAKGNAKNELAFDITRAPLVLNAATWAYAPGTYAALITVPANSIQYVDTTAVAGTYYSYIVSARNVAGTTASTAANSSATLAVPGPTNLVANVNAASAAVILTWTAVPGATSYVATINDGVNPPTQQTVVSGAYLPTTLPVGPVYTISVVAKRNALTSLSSATVTADLSVPPATPAVPTGLATTVSVPSGAVTVSWNAVTGATGYLLAVTTPGGAVIGSPYNVTGATTYNLPALPAGVTYTVSVAAYSTKFTIYTAISAYSAPVIASISTATPTGLSNTLSATTGAVTLKWNAATGASSYLVSVSSFVGGTTVTNVYTTATATYTPALALGSVYSITVASQGLVAGTMTTSPYSPALSVDLSAAAAPTVPVPVAGTPTAARKVTLTWPAVKNAAGTAASGYTVYVDGAAVGSNTITTTWTSPAYVSKSTHTFTVEAYITRFAAATNPAGGLKTVSGKSTPALSVTFP